MKALLIARREMLGYLRSPLGSAIIAGALLIEGLLFYNFALTEKMLSADVLREFFWICSGVTMIASVVLSIRLLAEERQMGTITLLNTAPLSDAQIVLGKFISAFVVLTIMTVLTLYMPALVAINGMVSVGHIVVGYVGLLLLGSATLSIGIFASALARSQVVAAIIGAAIVAALILLWMVARATEPPLNDYLAGLALHHENFQPFMVGVFELGNVVYYVMITYFFLLAATKVLEARRWR